MAKQEFVNRLNEAIKVIGEDAIPIIAKHLNIEIKDGRALCPFHKENTPSFRWNPRECFMKCFGCGKSYSILNVLIEQKGNTKEAINELFRMAQMEGGAYTYKPFDDEETDWFKDYMFPHEDGEVTDSTLKYLAKRGISKETIEKAGLREDRSGNIAFCYRDLDGKLLAVKYRLPRAIKKGESKMWFQKDSSTVPILWNVEKLDYTKPLVITEGECFPPDVDILTECGWIPFGQYNGQKVMMVDKFKKGKFVKPNHIVKKPFSGSLIQYNLDNFSIPTTPHHNLIFDDCKHLIKVPTSDALSHSIGRIHNIIEYNGKGYSSTEFFALHCLINTVCKKVDGRIESYIIVENKQTVQLCRTIEYYCNKLNVPYMHEINTINEPVLRVNFSAYRDVKYREVYLEMSLQEKYVVLDTLTYIMNTLKCTLSELLSKSSKLYHDFIDFVLGTLGIKNAVKYKHLYPNEQLCAYWDKVKAKETMEYIDYDGYVYCVNVDTGMIVVRYKGCTALIGNCDALSIIEAGYDNAVSVPNGANGTAWIEFNFDFLENFDMIKLWFDNDIHGKEGLDKIVPRLGEYRCEIIKPTADDEQMVSNYYEQFHCNGVTKTDANNILLACGKQRVLDLIQRAEGVPIKHLKYLMDCTVTNVMDMPKSSTGLKSLDNILYGNLYPCFTIYTGVAGSGKSSLCNLTSVISSIESGHRVFVFSGELDEGQLLSWIMAPLAGANHTKVWNNGTGRKGFTVTYEAENAIKKYYHDSIILYTAENELDTSEGDLFSTMEVAYKKYGCDVFVVDNLMCIPVDDTSDDDKWTAQKKFIIKLMKFTNDHSVSMNLVAHPRKPQGSQKNLGIYDISGASEIANLCHRLLAVKRLDDDEDGYSLELNILKDRPSQAAGKKCKLFYDPATRRIYSDQAEFAHQYKWEKGTRIMYDDKALGTLMINDRSVMDNVPKQKECAENACDQF